MYDDYFGTDWSELDDREEAVRRAFALGVAARLGERHPGELDRISTEVESSYDRSFVELAYHEGRDKASEHEATETDREDRVWAELVEGTTEFDTTLPGELLDEEDESGTPEMLDPTEPDSRPDDTREAVERPKFLSREEAEEPDRAKRRSRRSSSSDADEREEPSEEDRETFQELLDPSDGDDEE